MKTKLILSLISLSLMSIACSPEEFPSFGDEEEVCPSAPEGANVLHVAYGFEGVDGGYHLEVAHTEVVHAVYDQGKCFNNLAEIITFEQDPNLIVSVLYEEGTSKETFVKSKL